MGGGAVHAAKERCDAGTPPVGVLVLGIADKSTGTEGLIISNVNYGLS